MGNAVLVASRLPDAKTWLAGMGAKLAPLADPRLVMPWRRTLPDPEVRHRAPKPGRSERSVCIQTWQHGPRDGRERLFLKPVHFMDGAMAKLQQALKAVTTDLAGFAARGDYRSLFADVFGGTPGRKAAHAMQTQLLRRDLSKLARVEIGRAHV